MRRHVLVDAQAVPHHIASSPPHPAAPPPLPPQPMPPASWRPRLAGGWRAGRWTSILPTPSSWQAHPHARAGSHPCFRPRQLLGRHRGRPGGLGDRPQPWPQCWRLGPLQWEDGEGRAGAWLLLLPCARLCRPAAAWSRPPPGGQGRRAGQRPWRGVRLHRHLQSAAPVLIRRRPWARHNGSTGTCGRSMDMPRTQCTSSRPVGLWRVLCPRLQDHLPWHHGRLSTCLLPRLGAGRWHEVRLRPCLLRRAG